jgi:manganese/zinc/iron transport system substrate-binding protein
MRLRLAALFLLLFAMIGPAAAGEANEGRLDVVATVSMVGDAVRQVGGERVEVKTLMGEGVDPHLYRQTQADIAAMVRADLVFWNGLYLEAQLEEFLLRLAERKPVEELGLWIPEDKRIESPAYPGRYDPHVWMDPELWRYVVIGVRETLSELDPEGAAIYAANAEEYLTEIEALDHYAAEVLASVPEEKRVLVTAHDAFSYFGRAYDFEVLGIQGMSTESEAGLQRIDEIVSLLVERDIGAIFVESSVSERNIRALIEGAAARGHAVEIGGRLYSDAMGPAGTWQGTYLGMIDSNVTTVSRALGGEAPAGGMEGRLAGS